MGGADKCGNYNGWINILKEYFSNITHSVASNEINCITSHVQYEKVDTRASSYFLKSEHQDLLSNLVNLCEGPITTLPDNKKKSSYGKRNLTV